MREAGISSDRRCRKRKDLGARQIRVDLGLTGGVIRDLSENGMAVHTAEPLGLKPGERLHISIPDSRRPIQAGCELAWTDANSAGLRFLVLSESSQRSIMDWLNADSGETIWLPAPAQPAKNPITTPARVIAPGTAAAHPAISNLAPGAKRELTWEPARGQGNAAAVAHNAQAMPVAANGNAAGPQAAARATFDAGTEAALRFHAGLRLVAKLAQVLTSAEGAAIALAPPPEERQAPGAAYMICRASNGRAPEVGAAVFAGAGITGECVRTRSMVRSQDTHVDPRVDAEACGALGVRSVVAMPIFSGETLIGVIEVLSGAVDSFDEHGIRFLPMLAALLSHLAKAAANARNAAADPLQQAFQKAAATFSEAAHGKPQAAESVRSAPRPSPQTIWPPANG